MSRTLFVQVTVDDDAYPNAEQLAADLHALVQYDQERSKGDSDPGEDAIAHVESVDAFLPGEVVITTTTDGSIAELEVPTGAVVTIDRATGSGAEAFETTTYEEGRHTLP